MIAIPDSPGRIFAEQKALRSIQKTQLEDIHFEKLTYTSNPSRETHWTFYLFHKAV
jgi:hypothetical protein